MNAATFHFSLEVQFLLTADSGVSLVMSQARPFCDVTKGTHASRYLGFSARNRCLFTKDGAALPEQRPKQTAAGVRNARADVRGSLFVNPKKKNGHKQSRSVAEAKNTSDRTKGDAQNTHSGGRRRYEEKHTQSWV